MTCDWWLVTKMPNDGIALFIHAALLIVMRPPIPIEPIESIEPVEPTTPISL